MSGFQIAGYFLAAAMITASAWGMLLSQQFSNLHNTPFLFQSRRGQVFRLVLDGICILGGTPSAAIWLFVNERWWTVFLFLPIAFEIAYLPARRIVHRLRRTAYGFVACTLTILILNIVAWLWL